MFVTEPWFYTEACKGEHYTVSFPIVSAGLLSPPPPCSVCIAPLALSNASLSEPSSAVVRDICLALGWGFGIAEGPAVGVLGSTLLALSWEQLPNLREAQ